MNRDEFEFGFDPKNRKHAGQRQGTQVIPLSLPSVRLRQRENVPDEAPLSAESRKRIPIWIWTVILTKKRK
jgi:hypothetical protein